MAQSKTLAQWAFEYDSEAIGRSRIIHADCFEWLGCIPENSIHAIVTDPPYGVKEYDSDQIEKRETGNGGIWRIPPSFDGHTRQPLPRFTALNEAERLSLYRFFTEWARLLVRALRPGGHVFVASNAYLSQIVFAALVEGGLEFRGQIIRLVRTFRGGDRPKVAPRKAVVEHKRGFIAHSKLAHKEGADEASGTILPEWGVPRQREGGCSAGGFLDTPIREYDSSREVQKWHARAAAGLALSSSSTR